MTNAVNYLVPIILVGYIIYNVYRIILHRKLNKDRLKYQQMIEEKMNAMQTDIHSRARDLQDSIQMINQEYTKVMKSMSLQQRQSAEQLSQAVRDARKKADEGANQKSPEKPPVSDL
jgi:Skp family chaperone for outer membrane proteins